MEREVNLEEKIYQLHEDLFSIQEFEQWIYEHTSQLEKEIGETYALQLISFNYQHKYAKQEFFITFEEHIDLGKFATWRLKAQLQSIIDKDEYYADNLVHFYNLRCKGYQFLEELGIRYGLNLIAGFNDPIKDWRTIPESTKAALLNDSYEKIIMEAKRVQQWLDSGKIILTGKKEDAQEKLIYIDQRTKTELSPRELDWLKERNQQ